MHSLTAPLAAAGAAVLITLSQMRFSLPHSTGMQV